VKILIAEDDDNVRQLLAVTLTGLGHVPIEASDGERAWAEFELHHPRIVISDWNMPVVTGLDLCARVRERMRAEKGAEYTYFILLTGNEPTSKNYEKAIEKEVDDYLVKPMKESEIRGRLRVAERLLGMSRRLSDLELLVPMCAYCKRIRNDKGKYEAVETYLHQRTAMNFTHGICSECQAKHFPDSKR